MKILFYHPTSKSDGYPEPPLGLGYLMSIAREWNCSYEFYDEDHHSKFISLDELVSDFKPDLYAISCMTPQYYEVSKVVSKFKTWTPASAIIIGGPHPSALPEQTLQEIEEIDFLCKGEGEQTFEDFINYLSGKVDLESVNGLFYRRYGKVSANAPRQLMSSEELDHYSVDWEKLMGYGPYMQKLVYLKTTEPAAPVITTRGCPFECTFCDEGNIWQRKVRMRSIDSVIGEVKYLNSRFKVEHFNILDDTFTLKKSRVLELCHRIAPLNIKFRITATTRTVDAEILEHLKKAGCQLIAFGVESGDDEVLKRMKKRQTVADVRRAFELTEDANIPSYALCMVGNIGEDMDAVKRTATLIEEIKPDFFACSIMTPYPGSENYKTCKAQGWILHHEWEWWVPSVLKTKDFRVVSRTDKMNKDELIRAYYFMNRRVLIDRFKKKYGRAFLLSLAFYVNEILPRLKTIGYRTFLSYTMNIFLKNVTLLSEKHNED